MYVMSEIEDPYGFHMLEIEDPSDILIVAQPLVTAYLYPTTKPGMEAAYLYI